MCLLSVSAFLSLAYALLHSTPLSAFLARRLLQNRATAEMGAVGQLIVYKKIGAVGARVAGAVR